MSHLGAHPNIFIFLQVLICKKFWGGSATGAILYDPKVLK